MANTTSMHAICAHKDTRTTRNHEGDRLESKLISYKRRTITYCTCLLNQFEMLLTLETSLKRLFQALEERWGRHSQKLPSFAPLVCGCLLLIEYEQTSRSRPRACLPESPIILPVISSAAPKDLHVSLCQRT